MTATDALTGLEPGEWAREGPLCGICAGGGWTLSGAIFVPSDVEAPYERCKCGADIDVSRRYGPPIPWRPLT